MYIMAAVSAYGNGVSGRGGCGKKHGGCERRHGPPGDQGCDGRGRLSNVSAAGGGGGGVSCGSMADFELLEIDENDNSFPWGLIHHNELAHMLNNGLGKTMVIDSRSFLEYNTSNIHQSINVCCSKLVKRRLQQDKVHVLDLLNQACNVGADSSWDVIVYDQCTEDPSHLTSDNFVQVLLHKLSTTFNSVAFLKGGFLAFQASHPGLTENKSGAHRCSTLTSLSQPCMPVSNIGPTRILPFLYLGSQQDSLNQEVAMVNGITYILNVSKTCPRPMYILESHFHRIPVNDNYCEKLLPYFHEAFQFLDKVREANGCVLVHCLGGVSRSATLAIAYIMKHMKMSSDEAYRYVKDKRPTISPNFNFLGQLLEFEKIIRKEELLEDARREAFKANLSDEAVSYDSERASPGSMDLHTSSPSSPGPRGLRQSIGAASLFKMNLSQESYLSSDGVSRQLSAWSPRPYGFSDCPVAGEKQYLAKEINLGSLRGHKSYRDAACFNAGIQATITNPSYQLSRLTQTNICDKTPGQAVSLPAQSPVCPISGFPSPGGAHQDFPESTCTDTGFPGPEQYGSGDFAMTHTLQCVDTPAHHTNVISSNTLMKNNEIRDSSPAAEQTVQKEFKDQQPKARQGISFSSILSNFRWKSRPPTLPLGSPVGPVKDVGRHGKKQGGEGSDSRVQLTPVSEAVENSYLSETSAVVVIDCSEKMEVTDTLSVQTLSNSGSSCATNSTTASIVTMTTSASSTTEGTSTPTSNLELKSASLRLSARHFTLALSSPTSDFPVTFSPSSNKLASPTDSNKRKSGLIASESDSPDKLAKTDSHLHGPAPPKTLNISQGPPDKLKQGTPARRSFVLPISSPTTAMARLNFASPSEPNTEGSSLAAPEVDSTTVGTSSTFLMDMDKQRSLSSASSNSLLLNTGKLECLALQSTVIKTSHCNAGGNDCSVIPSLSSSSMPLTSCSSSSMNSSSSVQDCAKSLTSSSPVSLQGFQELPTTSLDKLSFTPCYTKDIVYELKSRELAALASREDQGDSRPSVLDSPMSISSGSSVPSLASSTLSPVDSLLVNPFSDSSTKLCNDNLPTIQPESHSFSSTARSEIPPLPPYGTPRDSPDSILSPSGEFNLSPSSMPQATLAPTLPSLTSPVYYSSTSSLSPMSITDSASGSPNWLSKRSSVCSPVQSSASSPVLSLSSPNVYSPSLSPMVTSPVSSSFHLASTPSSTSSSSTAKVVRRDKSKRVIDRPYSIAFSSYPACDLVSSTPDGMDANSNPGQTSQDDASEAYMSVSGKRSRLSVTCERNTHQGRTSWAGYSEREVYNKYKQITAAMENAMMRTQVFSLGPTTSSLADQARASSRKARSLEDFLDSGTEGEEPLMFKGGNQQWRRYGEQHLLEPYHCGMRSAGEPYHSSSSLSSNGSHGSSLEIIQVS